MKIEEIKLGKRFREKTRNIDTLCESIKKIGLLHPIVIDENNVLIVGLGRLRAFEELGYNEIPATKINLGKMIDEESGFKNVERAQIDENVTRRDFAPSEAVDIWMAMEKKSGGDRKSKFYTKIKLSESDSLIFPIERASKILSISTDTLSRAKQVVDYGNQELIEEMDKTGNVNKAYAEVRRLKREKELDLKEYEGSKVIKDIEPGWYKLGNQHLYYGSNLEKQFIKYLPKCKLAFADPPYNAGVDDWDKDFKWEQDYLQDVAEIVAVTPGGWNAFNFYRETNMIYVWEMCCWISNGMTHGKCGYANFIKTSIFGKGKVKIPQDFFQITIKTSETEDTKHKGRKPYAYMWHIIDLFTSKKDCIVDPFAGSGTTLLMSEKMERVSYNAEIKKEHCLQIINRTIE